MTTVVESYRDVIANHDHENCKLTSCRIMSHADCAKPLVGSSRVSIGPVPGCSIKAQNNDAKGYKLSVCLSYEITPLKQNPMFFTKVMTIIG